MTEHTSIAAALVAALADLTVVEKGRKVNMELKSGKRLKYDYAALEDVVKVTRPVLAEHGVVALTPVHDHGSGLACTVILLHSSGDRLDLGPFPFPHGADAQATGSMVTYHRRYSLLAALGMAAGDDDDDGALATVKAQAADQQRSTPADGPISAENAEAMVVRCEEKGVSVAEVVLRGTDGRTSEPAEVLRSEVGAIKQAMDDLAAAPTGVVS